MSSSTHKALADVIKDKAIGGLVVELIDELLFSIDIEIDSITDHLDIDTMSRDFFMEWLFFYGLRVKYADNGVLDRNAVRRMIGLLKHRGSLGSIYSAITSGGGLFINEPINASLYHWYEVPERVQPFPVDGVIYIESNDDRVVFQSDLLLRVKPAGYRFELFFYRLVKPVNVPQAVVSYFHVRYSDLSVQHEVSTSYSNSISRLIDVPHVWCTSSYRWSLTSVIRSGLSVAKYFSDRNVPGYWVHIFRQPINPVAAQPATASRPLSFCTPFWSPVCWYRSGISISKYIKLCKSSYSDPFIHIQRYVV